jgi:branched-chain amino acid transport system ATP-binding protein
MARGSGDASLTAGAHRRSYAVRQQRDKPQQMLAIGRALMTNPKLLILDEATEGLAPIIRAEIWSCLERLKAMGQSILIIDKNIANITRIADYHYVLRRGSIVWKGTSSQLLGAPAIQKEHLGI